MSKVPFRAVLGSLLCVATRTRPYISTAVSMLAIFQETPSPIHWRTLKHVVRYVKKTVEYGIWYPKSGHCTLSARSDADWSRYHGQRSSRTGYALIISEAPVVWCSELQSAVTLSTSEAEFYALSSSARELVWTRSVLTDLGQGIDALTTVYEDNLGTIAWTKNVQGLRNVKHVGLKYHYVLESVVGQKVEVVYTPSIENRADGLTKALIGEPFSTSCDRLGVIYSVGN